MKYRRRPQVWFGSLILFLHFGCSLSFGSSSTGTRGRSSHATQLFQLAERRYPNLSAAERKLVEAAADGTDIDCSAVLAKDSIIRAELLAWLCIDVDASKQVTSRGVSISEATIEGELNLERSTIPFPVRIADSVFHNSVNIRDAHLVSLDLSDTHVPNLLLSGARIERSVYLCDGFESESGVNLTATKIGGDLFCTTGKFVGQVDQPALNADRADIKGAVFMNEGFTAQGSVGLTNATIGLSLVCTGGKFVGARDQPALSANGSDIKGSVFMNQGFTAQGGVNLVAATIGSSLECTGGKFVGSEKSFALDATGAKIQGFVLLNEGFTAQGGVNLTNATVGLFLGCSGGKFVGQGVQPALNADSADLKGAVFMNEGFTAQGSVGLTNATIGSSLVCTGGKFVGARDQPALSANGSDIKNSVFMNEGFTAQGGVNLGAATIGSSLECTGGKFVGAGDQPALSANGSDIKGGVFMKEGFTAQGGVNLVGAAIGSSLECTGGKFVGSEKSFALDAAAAKIKGFVLLNNNLATKNDFSAEGEVRFTSAAIGGDLYCVGCRLVDSKWNATALDAQSAKIDGSVYLPSESTVDGAVNFSFATITRDFQWSNVKLREHATLNLEHGTVGSIVMELPRSPARGYISIDGLVYDHIDGLSSTTSANPLRWIRLQTHNRFLPQPYEQLYSILRKMGFQEDAVKVMIAKNDEAGDFVITEASRAIAKNLSEKRYLKGLGALLMDLWDICWYKIFGRFIGYGYIFTLAL